MDQDIRRKELLSRFLSDQCTPEELEELLGYLKQPKYREAYAEVLEKVWRQLDQYQPLEDSRSEAIYQKIVTSQPASKTLPGIKISRWSAAYRMAAVFIGFLLIAGIGFILLRKDTTHTYSTDYGQIQAIQLPDGSLVTLNGNSTLHYSGNWETRDADESLAAREIWLEGEAFFEVQEVVLPNKEKAKFVVHTPQLDVEVVGTTFNVRNRQSQTQVVLNSGKVKLRLPAGSHKDQPADTIWMDPGDLVAFSEKDQTIEQRKVASDLYSSWKDHQLIFVNTPIHEIAGMLEDTYGFEVVLESEQIGKKRFNGTVSTGEVDLLLKAISTTFNINIQQKGKVITMEKK